MKKLFSIMCLFALIVTSFSANASEKIAIVDVASVVKKSTAAQNLYKQLEKQRNKLQDKVTKKEDELRNEERDLAKQRSLISKDAFEERSRAFKEKMIEAQKDLQKDGAKLQRGFEQSMNTIKKEMLSIIASIAKEDDITVVAPKANLLFAKDASDISSKVIQKLNDELDEIKLDIN